MFDAMMKSEQLNTNISTLNSCRYFNIDATLWRWMVLSKLEVCSLKNSETTLRLHQIAYVENFNVKSTLSKWCCNIICECWMTVAFSTLKCSKCNTLYMSALNFVEPQSCFQLSYKTKHKPWFNGVTQHFLNFYSTLLNIAVGTMMKFNVISILIEIRTQSLFSVEVGWRLKLVQPWYSFTFINCNIHDCIGKMFSFSNRQMYKIKSCFYPI